MVANYSFRHYLPEIDYIELKQHPSSKLEFLSIIPFDLSESFLILLLVFSLTRSSMGLAYDDDNNANDYDDNDVDDEWRCG